MSTLTGAPYGQTETGAAYTEAANATAVSTSDVAVGMTIRVLPGEPLFKVARIEDGEYFRFAWNDSGEIRALYPDTWVALEVTA